MARSAAREHLTKVRAPIDMVCPLVDADAVFSHSGPLLLEVDSNSRSFQSVRDQLYATESLLNALTLFVDCRVCSFLQQELVAPFRQGATGLDPPFQGDLRARDA